MFLVLGNRFRSIKMSMNWADLFVVFNLVHDHHSADHSLVLTLASDLFLNADRVHPIHLHLVVKTFLLGVDFFLDDLLLGALRIANHVHLRLDHQLHTKQWSRF